MMSLLVAFREGRLTAGLELSLLLLLLLQIPNLLLKRLNFPLCRGQLVLYFTSQAITFLFRHKRIVL
jgi:hypothetical protein